MASVLFVAYLARYPATCPSVSAPGAGRYTLIDRSAESELLPLCLEVSVAVVAAGVYNSGLLADPRPGAPFDYRPAPQERLEIATRVAELSGSTTCLCVRPPCSSPSLTPPCGR